MIREKAGEGTTTNNKTSGITPLKRSLEPKERKKNSHTTVGHY